MTKDDHGVREPVMRRRGHSGLIAACVAFAVTVPAMARAAEPAGKRLYLRYCASCHGATGKGDGAVAPALTRPATDLTRLKADAGGKFPFEDVMRAIDGRRAIVAHGTREMPVWGQHFKEVLAGRQRERTAVYATRDLAEYIATLQQGTP